MITQSTSPWPMSTRVAPSATRRSDLRLLIDVVGRSDVEMKPVLPDLRDEGPPQAMNGPVPFGRADRGFVS